MASLATKVDPKVITMKPSNPAVAFLHGTKKSCEDPARFWNSILGATNHRCVLLSTTNEAWISKSDADSREVASLLVGALQRGAHITIMSEDRDDVVEFTTSFFKNYFFPCLMSDPPRLPLEKYLDGINLYFHKGTFYTLNIFDRKYFLMPKMNTLSSKSESIIIELDGDMHGECVAGYEKDLIAVVRCSRAVSVASLLD